MRILAWIGLICLTGTAGYGQVSAELVLDQTQFLHEESLPVKVRITNRSGQTVPLGTEPDWLSFTLEHKDRHVISQSSDMDLKGEFTLDSAFAATKTVDLLPFYDLQPGRYTLTATVKVKAWKQEFSTAAKSFEIVRGTKTWEQEFGVSVSNRAPEVRKYILQQAQYQKRLMLYLRVTDGDERQVFRVTPVAPLVSFSRPEAQVDGTSHLHLLFQTGARSFRYFVYNPAGEIVMRQTHDYASNRPVLKANAVGNIYVTGGTRRFLTDDLPPLSTIVATSSTNEVAKP